MILLKLYYRWSPNLMRIYEQSKLKRWRFTPFANIRAGMNCLSRSTLMRSAAQIRCRRIKCSWSADSRSSKYNITGRRRLVFPRTSPPWLISKYAQCLRAGKRDVPKGQDVVLSSCTLMVGGLSTYICPWMCVARFISVKIITSDVCLPVGPRYGYAPSRVCRCS